MAGRVATEADIPWISERVRQKQQWLELGEFDPSYVADAIQSSNVVTDGKSVILGMECPIVSSGAPAVNQAWFWDGKQTSFNMLAEHEASSDLPSLISVPWKHERREALMRALQRRGYRPFEILMVQ